MGSPKSADDFKSVCKQDCKADNMFEYFNQGLNTFRHDLFEKCSIVSMKQTIKLTKH